MTSAELKNKKQTLLAEVNKLIKIKKSLFKNIDIELPMSDEEKALNKLISRLWSEINTIVREINKIKKLAV